jgi:hypothetical protein
MFGNNIVADYVESVNEKDITTTCRNIARECFTSYGGDKFSNFYNPASGLFKPSQALDWFTLYGTVDEKIDLGNDANGNKYIVSQCARKLIEIPECAEKELLEKVFGGFDKLYASGQTCFEYGLIRNQESVIDCSNKAFRSSLDKSDFRQAGVATEIYNEIVGVLQQSCKNLNGSFMEQRYLDASTYCTLNNPACANLSNECMIAEITGNKVTGITCATAYLENIFEKDPYLVIDKEKEDQGGYSIGNSVNALFAIPDEEEISPCIATFFDGTYKSIVIDYNFAPYENLCPLGYSNIVDIESWGICSCWHNGGRRAKEGLLGCSVHIPNDRLYKYPDDETVKTGHDAVYYNIEGQVCPSTVSGGVSGKGSCECPLWEENVENCTEDGFTNEQ